MESAVGKHWRALVWAVVALAATLIASVGMDRQAQAQTRPPLKIGVVTILDGAFASLGEQGLWGAKTALVEAGGRLRGTGSRDTVTGAKAGGRRIQLFIEGTDGTGNRALEAARRLVEQRDVDILVGPLGGGEGLALKEYAKQHLDTTFVSGGSSAQNLTLRDPAPNYFRFSADAVQMTVGLGTYAYRRMGIRRVATIGEDYAFPYDQVGAFVREFCKAGGSIVSRTWVPIGTTDYSSSVVRIPREADAVLAVLSGRDALNFIRALDQFGRQNLRVIGGAVTVDPIMIRSLGRRAEGVVSGSPVAVLNTLAYKQYVRQLKKSFPQSPGPGLNDVAYYTAITSVIKALNATKGNTSSGHVQLRRALAQLKWNTPTGPVRLDANRQAVVNTYVTRIVKGQKRIVSTNRKVTQTPGMSRVDYLALGSFSRDNPSCSR